MNCIIKDVLKVNHHLNLEYYKSDRKLSNGEFLSFSQKFKTFYGNAYVTYMFWVLNLVFKPFYDLGFLRKLNRLGTITNQNSKHYHFLGFIGVSCDSKPNVFKKTSRVGTVLRWI